MRESVAYNLTSFAWDWHSEGLNGRTSDVLAFDSYGFIGGGRGTGNSVVDSAGYGLLKGIGLYEYGDGDARNLTFDNINLRAVRDYGYAITKAPRDNLISNSTFEVLYGATSLGAAGRLENVNVIRGKLAPDDFMTGTAASDKLLGGEGATSSGAWPATTTSGAARGADILPPAERAATGSPTTR